MWSVFFYTWAILLLHFKHQLNRIIILVNLKVNQLARELVKMFVAELIKKDKTITEK